MKHHALTPKNSALLIVDVQEKLFPLVEHPCEMLDKGLLLIEGCKLLDVPVVLSEQYPKGLGHTIQPIRERVGEEVPCFAKTTFSCTSTPLILAAIKEFKKTDWILMGIEAHVCILQTARGLLEEGFSVTVANDAISSRSIYDFSTAIAELRDMGARISSVETIIFELMQDSKHQNFKAVSELIKGSKE